MRRAGAVGVARAARAALRPRAGDRAVRAVRDDRPGGDVPRAGRVLRGHRAGWRAVLGRARDRGRAARGPAAVRARAVPARARRRRAAGRGDGDDGRVTGATGAGPGAAGDVAAGWSPDPLLAGHEVRTLAGWWPASGGPSWPAVRAGGAAPVLTLVRPVETPAAPRGVVVHLHGYNDYYFQSHLADAVRDAGWAFLALDARRAGRSHRPGDVPHYQGDLREQASDLTRAVAAARSLWPGLPVVVHAHSTGGLVAALWAHAHRVRGGADAVVLNSPFLSVERSWVTPLQDQALRPLARTAPLRVVSAAPSRYAGRMRERWEFDTDLKRPDGVPVRAGWLAAVRRGQRRVASGLEIGVPLLVARSARSGADLVEGADLDSVDTVLDVATIAALGPGLGTDVRELVVDGGVHDLALSHDEPRGVYLDALGRFLAEVAGAGAPRRMNA
ncbi:alpha/beta fold hydrolase [Cellulomonas shaoxiangyii]|nr:alpha/beta fold hydrolase [Cellulomonas shaoxiangyii]